MAYESETEKLRKKYADKPEQWFAALADHYRKGKELEVALRIVRDGLNKRPNYVSGHIVLGRCLVDDSNDVEAEGVFEQVLRLDPENIIALRALGEISNRAGSASGARKWFSRLLEVDPMNEEAQEALDGLEHDDYAPPEVDVAEMAIASGAESPAVDPDPPIEDPPAETAEPSVVSDQGDEQDLGAFEVKPYPSYETAAAPADPIAEPPNADAIEIENEDVNWGEMTPAPVGEADVERSDATPWSREEMDAADEAETNGSPVEDVVSAPNMLPHEIPETFPVLSSDPTDEDFTAGFEPVSLEDLADADTPTEATEVDTQEEDPFEAAFAGELPENVTDAEGTEPANSGDLEPSTPTAELPLTETMAEVYASQGMLGEARRVYARLIEANPEDEGLRARSEALDERVIVGSDEPASESEADEPEPQVVGGTSVRALFAGILAARLSTDLGRPAAAPAVPEPEVLTAHIDVDLEKPTPELSDLTPLESAFSDPGAGGPTDGPEYADEDVPLSDVLEEEAAASVEAKPTPSQDGMSFDQFFGSVAPEESVPMPESSAASASVEEDDEEEFKAWLKSLKS